ncbi:THAP domain-containing protein 5 [Frankliniella fusca]|uniref:THAP domain-containing protein 5 n=1 Tax=Frankliniella fusca TaxID=407009 RepID=A0AAE1LJ19_9NEOP|nr:THAP domain-containing protein 5 [Frankliniella fusca]
MPRCCSVPGCKSGYKQGLSLLCYPKDAQRRAAWLQTLRDNGMSPTNNQFVCELHFGPDQWEKVRVDGTRKLKWSGVPNVLDPAQVEEARENVKSRRKALAAQPITVKRKPARIIQEIPTQRKHVKCACPEDNIEDPLHLPLQNSLQDSDQDAFQGSSKNCRGNVIMLQSAPTIDVPASQPLIVESFSLPNNLHAEIGSQQASSDLDTPNPTSVESEEQSNLQFILPVPGKDHSIIVSMPQTHFRTRLAEDLDDVKNFLSKTECSLEEKLVRSLTYLVEKHQLLDKKFQAIEALSKEHLSLKRKLKFHERVLLENKKLKAKLQKYEKQASIENASSKKKSGGDSYKSKTDGRNETTPTIPQWVDAGEGCL